MAVTHAVVTSETTGQLVLHGPLDGRCSAALREVLRDRAAATTGDLVVDMSDVESVDVTALAVLAGATRALARDHRRLVLRGCSPSLRRALAFTRLRRVFRLEGSLPTQQR